MHSFLLLLQYAGAVCNMAIPNPMMKEEANNIGYVCIQANRMVPMNGIRKPPNNTGFSPKRSISNPAGIDMMAYARKKEVGINPAIARSLRLKLWIMSGMSGPRILVINEMVNQNAIISANIPKFFLII